MTKLNTYLNFPGNTEEAFTFYRSVFGGDFSSLVRFKDMPMEGVKMPKKDENKIMHIGLPIGGASPAEIAVSVAAQLVQVRNARGPAVSPLVRNG